jgi:TPR repeat protein
MKRLTATLCLTIALLLGSAGMSWSADYGKGYIAAQSGDFATALREWRPLAKQGNAYAQFNLGGMYDSGRGVPQDYKTAAKWYRLAAEQGDADSQHNLGLMYAKGQGVIQDNIYAHMWFNIAGSSGDKIAVKYRDIVAKRMIPANIFAAQKLARKCVRKKYRGC